MSTYTPRIGIGAAIASVLFAACFSIVALAANFTMLIPATWVNPLSLAASLLLAVSSQVARAGCTQAVRDEVFFAGKVDLARLSTAPCRVW